MYAPMTLVSVIDIVGSSMTIALSFYAVYIMRKTYRQKKYIGLYIYLYAQTIALAIFATSRSVGHIAKHVLVTFGLADVWKALAPVSGSINSFTFIVFGLAAILYSNIKTMSDRIDVLEKSREDLRQSREMAMKSLEEKEVLLKEVHHRVKNNLAIVSSLLTMQSRRVKGVKNIRAFKDSRDRIMSMALIHEKLYQSEDLRNINVEEYLQSLILRLMQSYGTGTENIALEMDIRIDTMEIDTLIPCGLMINELVSNSLKYAFLETLEGVLSISLSKDGDRFELEVADNGDGLPEGFETGSSETLGLQIVDALVGQLEGEMKIDTTEGTRFMVSFKDRGTRPYLSP